MPTIQCNPFIRQCDCAWLDDPEYELLVIRHTDAALLVDVSGHDANLALLGLDDTGAVGANEPGVASLQERLDLLFVYERAPASM